MLEFVNAVFWELIQNLPIVLLFVMAVWLWARQRRQDAIICCVVGGVVGALLIRFTEPIISGYHESWNVTLMNIGVFSLAQVLFTVYLGAESCQSAVSLIVLSEDVPAPVWPWRRVLSVAARGSALCCMHWLWGS